MGMNCHKVAKHLVKQLKDLGFTIQRYDAMTSNSVYLKLDYGVCNTVRISDHQGKKHLAYRFNVTKGVGNSYIDLTGKYPQYYYSYIRLDEVVDAIVDHRQNKLNQYGEMIYKIMMNESKKMNKNAKGFWQKAHLV